MALPTKRNREWFFLTSTRTNARGKTMRFKDGEEPDEVTMKDFLESIIFKLNKQDRATTTTVGHSRVATDVEAKAGTSTGSNADANTDTNVAQPHQLPTVENAEAGSDTMSTLYENFEQIALTASVDNSVTTRNKFRLNLSSAFKTWLSTIINAIYAGIGTLNNTVDSIQDVLVIHGNFISDFTTRIGDAEGNITSNTNSIADHETRIDNLETAASSATPLLTKVLDIGAWDMDTTSSKSVVHGLDYTKIRSVNVLLTDGSGFYVPGAVGPDGSVSDFAITFTTVSGSIKLERVAGGVWDSATFNNAAINRGWITIHYLP